MKGFMAGVVSVGMLFSVGAFGVRAIDNEAKKSVYLPSTSWVISVLGPMLTPANGYNTAAGWEEKVIVAYGCVDSGAPDSAEMSSVLKKKTVGLTVPMADEPLIGPAALSVTVEFKDEQEDIKTVMTGTQAPAEAEYSVRLLNLGSAGHYEKEIEKMTEEQVHVLVTDFTFDNQVEICSAGMDVYTWGYVLEDKDKKKLFWCCHEVGPFEGGKFHPLNEVLDAYKRYKKNRKELDAGHTQWV
jgi:hypothetical protein